jgi:hypothetical protein
MEFVLQLQAMTRILGTVSEKANSIMNLEGVGSSMLKQLTFLRLNLEYYDSFIQAVRVERERSQKEKVICLIQQGFCQLN